MRLRDIPARILWWLFKVIPGWNNRRFVLRLYLRTVGMKLVD